MCCLNARPVHDIRCSQQSTAREKWLGTWLHDIMICGVQKDANMLLFFNADGHGIWEGQQHISKAASHQLRPLLHVELISCKVTRSGVLPVWLADDTISRQQHLEQGGARHKMSMLVAMQAQDDVTIDTMPSQLSYE